MKKYKIFLIVCLIVALIMPFFIWLGQETYYQIHYKPIIEKSIGLVIGSPYIDGDEVIALYPQKNSIAEKAGVKNLDILQSHSIGSFVKQIYDSRGKNISFNVQRNSQIVTITIPLPQSFDSN